MITNRYDEQGRLRVNVEATVGGGPGSGGITQAEVESAIQNTVDGEVTTGLTTYGAATDTNLDDVETNLLAVLNLLARDTNLDDLETALLAAIGTLSTDANVDNLETALLAAIGNLVEPGDLAALSTDANLDDLETALLAAIGDLATETTLASLATDLGTILTTLQDLETRQDEQLQRVRARNTVNGSVIANTAGITAVIAAPPAGQAIVLKGFRIYRFDASTTSLTATLFAGTDVVAELPLPGEGDGEVVEFPEPNWRRLPAATPFNVTLSNALETRIIPLYYIEDTVTGLPV